MEREAMRKPGTLAIGGALFIGAASMTLAGPCDPVERHPGGTRDVWVIEVENGEKEYRDTRPLVLPLVTPREVPVPVARFFVGLERERRTSTGPLDLGALEEAYEAATLEPDALVEAFYDEASAERAAFDSSACQTTIESTMAREGARIKAMEFGAPTDVSFRSGWTEVGRCRLTAGGRTLQATIHFRLETRYYRRTRERVGEAEAGFRLRWRGAVPRAPLLRLEFQVPSAPSLRVVDLAEGTVDSAVRIRLATMREDLEEEVRRLRDEVRGREYTLTDDEQAALCSGESGEARKIIPFRFGGRDRELVVHLRARREIEVGGALGRTPAVCTRIDCDCSRLDFGLLTRAYRETCRGHEAGLRQACEDTGEVTGRCHPTASGPDPWP